MKGKISLFIVDAMGNAEKIGEKECDLEFDSPIEVDGQNFFKCETIIPTSTFTNDVIIDNENNIIRG